VRAPGDDSSYPDPSGAAPAARSIEHFQIAEIGNGEVVLLDTERLHYHTLNGSAYVR
jgi:hypothetical protein